MQRLTRNPPNQTRSLILRLVLALLVPVGVALATPPEGSPRGGESHAGAMDGNLGGLRVGQRQDGALGRRGASPREVPVAPPEWAGFTGYLRGVVTSADPWVARLSHPWADQALGPKLTYQSFPEWGGRPARSLETRLREAQRRGPEVLAALALDPLPSEALPGLLRAHRLAIGTTSERKVLDRILLNLVAGGYPLADLCLVWKYADLESHGSFLPSDDRLNLLPGILNLEVQDCRPVRWERNRKEGLFVADQRRSPSLSPEDLGAMVEVLGRVGYRDQTTVLRARWRWINHVLQGEIPVPFPLQPPPEPEVEDRPEAVKVEMRSFRSGRECSRRTFFWNGGDLVDPEGGKQYPGDLVEDLLTRVDRASVTPLLPFLSVDPGDCQVVFEVSPTKGGPRKTLLAQFECLRSVEAGPASGSPGFVPFSASSASWGPSELLLPAAPVAIIDRGLRLLDDPDAMWAALLLYEHTLAEEDRARTLPPTGGEDAAFHFWKAAGLAETPVWPFPSNIFQREGTREVVRPKVTLRWPPGFSQPIAWSTRVRRTTVAGPRKTWPKKIFGLPGSATCEVTLQTPCLIRNGRSVLDEEKYPLDRVPAIVRELTDLFGSTPDALRIRPFPAPETRPWLRSADFSSWHLASYGLAAGIPGGRDLRDVLLVCLALGLPRIPHTPEPWIWRVEATFSPPGAAGGIGGEAQGWWVDAEQTLLIASTQRRNGLTRWKSDQLLLAKAGSPYLPEGSRLVADLSDARESGVYLRFRGNDEASAGLEGVNRHFGRLGMGTRWKPGDVPGERLLEIYSPRKYQVFLEKRRGYTARFRVIPEPTFGP